MQNQKPGGNTAAPPAGSSPATNLKRRRFLFSLGAGGASAAAAAAVAAVPGVPVVEVADTSSNVDGAGYRETQHVRDYYRTAKI